MKQPGPHRAWPVPDRPWIMKQTWNDVLFAHWPVPIESLQAIVPTPLAIDTFDGQGWIGIVPFWMSGVRPRFMPPLPYFSRFPELNLRTYVTLNGKPGVWFISMDAYNKFAVEAARLIYHLPYFHANIRYSATSREVNYLSIRKDNRANPGQFAAAYRPISDVYFTEPGTLEHFLTARFCLYSIDTQGRLYRGDIDHQPWPLQHAEADIGVNTLPASFHIPLPPDKPLLHYARQVHVRIWILDLIYG